jgi:transcriptional regulator with XRE-family HTH domain
MSFDDIAARLRKHADEKDEQQRTPPNFEELYLLRARILGVLIRDARQAAGMSPEDCAAQVNVSAAVLDSWEFGRAMPSLPQIELLAYALGVPISHFWGTSTLLERDTRQDVDIDEYVTLRNHLIGALLRAAREQANLTPEQLAADAGVSPVNIAAYELGQRPVPAPVLSTLASVCRVNLSYFLENGNKVASFLQLQEDMKNFGDLLPEVRRFVASPTNQPYIELAMRLAQMGTAELRGVAEALLEITL